MSRSERLLPTAPARAPSARPRDGFADPAGPNEDADVECELEIVGVRSTEYGWTIAGTVTSTGEEFLATIQSCRRAPPRDTVAVWTGSEFFTVCVEIAPNIASRCVFDLRNGEQFCDEDGDLNYAFIGLHPSVWRYVYGRIMAPVYLHDDQDCP
jgi:hypothetical protein